MDKAKKEIQWSINLNFQPIFLVQGDGSTCLAGVKPGAQIPRNHIKAGRGYWPLAVSALRRHRWGVQGSSEVRRSGQQVGSHWGRHLMAACGVHTPIYIPSDSHTCMPPMPTHVCIWMCNTQTQGRGIQNCLILLVIRENRDRTLKTLISDSPASESGPLQCPTVLGIG